LWRRWVVGPAVALGCLGALLGASTAQATKIRTAATEPRKGEATKTIPITKKVWQKPRVVSTLGPGSLGSFEAGDRIEAGFDVEVSVCLKKAHSSGLRSNFPCPGKLYGFDPSLRTKVVIAGSRKATKGVEVTPVKSSLCTQKPLRRNHHCVIQSPWKGIRLPDSGLPCKPAQCHFNVVMSAFDKEARNDGKNKVILGGQKLNGKISQGKTKFALALFPDGERRPLRTWRKTKRVSGSYRLDPNLADNKKKRVILSQRLTGLRKGDQLLVDAQMATSINHLPYDTFQRTEVVLSNKPKSIKPRGSFTETTARVGEGNGFNCTRRKSGHVSPCVVRKIGVLSIRRKISKPVYVNVIAAGTAKGPPSWTNRWRPGHKAKIIGRRSFIHVERFTGTSSCKGCATGWIEFSPRSKPPGSKQQKLAAQLQRVQVPRGQINCSKRGRHGTLTCDWRANGRFGDSPRYECSSKAWWRPESKSWELNACKDALGAHLWHQLERRGQKPTFAGSCKELGGGRWRCNWWADDPFCKGQATYDRSRGRWAISPRCG
jgi:hypothetical protein